MLTLREDADEIEGARESPGCFERTAEIAASYGARDKPCLLEAAAAGSVPVTSLCSPASTDGGSDSGASSNDDDDDDEVCVPVCRRASAARSESFRVDDVEHAPACEIGTFDYCGGFEAFDSDEDLPGPPG
ncbi:hypothetical protein DIPPA_02533 [Diplonema papillatum]|nr:hypothetical protein DIPPA_02533 [Diplonema papillatum]